LGGGDDAAVCMNAERVTLSKLNVLVYGVHMRG
jgi:hypothetical protein